MLASGGPMPDGAGEAFTLLTTEPGPDVAPIHNRQMVVLNRSDWLAWLDLTRPNRTYYFRFPPGASLSSKSDNQRAQRPQSFRSHRSLALAAATGLPLHVRHRVGAAARERDDVIFAVAGAGTHREPRRRAGMFALEFPRHLARSIVPRRDWDGHERHDGRDDDPASRQCHASHTRSVVTTAVQKMMPSAVFARSPRVGSRDSWPMMSSRLLSIRAKSVLA